jgi:hypothetical protein
MFLEIRTTMDTEEKSATIYLKTDDTPYMLKKCCMRVGDGYQTTARDPIIDPRPVFLDSTQNQGVSDTEFTAEVSSSESDIPPKKATRRGRARHVVHG